MGCRNADGFSTRRKSAFEPLLFDSFSASALGLEVLTKEVSAKARSPVKINKTIIVASTIVSPIPKWATARFRLIQSPF